MPDGAGGNKPDPDEVDRELRRLTEEVGKSRVREPSALERMVAARQAEKKAQRKKDSRVLVLLVLAVLVIAGGGVATWLRIAPPSWFHHRAGGHAASPTAAPKVRLTTTPLNPVTSNGPGADPFSGSPADGWAVGAAGITIPAARAHGPYSAAQVRSAYQMTRQLLIAGNLNWPTLRGGTPAAFADLLTKQQRARFLAGLHTTALAKDRSEKNTRTWVSSFAPGSTQFVTTAVKVHGTMSARATTESGTEVLRVSFDYLFVYAVEPPGKPAEWMRVVQQQFGDVDFARWDDPGGRLEPWIISHGFNTGGVQCAERDGYIHPDYPLGPSSGPPPSGAPHDPYSLATPPAGTLGGCQPVTRT